MARTRAAGKASTAMRPYQHGFYEDNERTRDEGLRHAKAHKIVSLLRAYSVLPLDRCSCVDVGCASGTITRDVATLFARTVGIEYDMAALRDAGQSDATVTFVLGDAMDLPVAGASAHAVVCNQVYEHVPDMDRLFAELYRVLHPEGLVVFAGPNRAFIMEPHYGIPGLHWLPRPWADALLRRLGRGEHYYETLRTRAQLRKQLAKFHITDAMRDVVLLAVPDGPLRRVLARVPRAFWPAVSGMAPAHNWILTRRVPVASKSPQ
jgi:2-polyprenyl-3-methyl-5-hydroxy-6-metoxy-1,4-benzoquinol methylase